MGLFSCECRGTKQVHLALLHPKEVAVYSLSSQSSDDPSGPDQSLSEPSDQYQLGLVYSHSLSRTSCNVTIGSFGRTEGILLLQSCQEHAFSWKMLVCVEVLCV